MSDKPKRRWYQFSLKTLLVVLTLLCLGPGGYVAFEQNKARRQKAAVEAIEKLGGTVAYDHEVPPPPRSALMRQILGDESFGYVCVVSFAGTQETDAGLVHLSGLSELDYLSLDNSKVTDAGLLHLVGLKGLMQLWLDNTQVTDSGLVHLSGLKSLTHLSLSDTQVTDAGLLHLLGLKGLTDLWLDNTQVTDAGVAELQKALPQCGIYR